MGRVRVMGAVLLCLSCGGPVPAPAPASRPPAPPLGADFEYLVRADAALSALDVTVCGREPLRQLAPSRSTAPGHLVHAEVRAPGAAPRPIATGGRVLRLGGLAPGDCVGYVVDVRRAAGRARWGRSDDHAVVLPSTDWLWRPGPRRDDATATIRFELPEGVRASVPWPREGDGHRIDESAYRFLAHTAFGRFDVEEIEVGGGEVALARLPGELRVDDEGARQYVRAAAGAVATLFGRLPLARIQVLLVPVGPGRDPVAFGHVGRGGGGSVLLFVRSDAQLDAMRRDWIAVHELSHLALPYVRRTDAWISEGTATYYQEVLRARGGLIEPLEAWRAIDDGLRRGRGDGTGGSLREESQRMVATHAFRRVYWGGAAFALELDVALRRRGSSLDALLAALLECCGERRGAWTAEGLLAELDRLAGSSLPSDVAERHLAATDLPELGGLYAFLGLRRAPGGELVLDDTAPGADVRRAITSPPDGLEDQGPLGRAAARQGEGVAHALGGGARRGPVPHVQGR